MKSIFRLSDVFVKYLTLKRKILKSRSFPFPLSYNRKKNRSVSMKIKIKVMMIKKYFQVLFTRKIITTSTVCLNTICSLRVNSNSRYIAKPGRFHDVAL